MSVKVDNDKKKRYVLREVLFNGKNGSIINKAITMKQDNKYGFVTIKRIQIKPEESNLIEKYDKESKEAQLIEHDNLIQYYDNFLCEVDGKLEYWQILEFCSQKSIFLLCDLSIGMEHLIRSSHQQHFLLNPHNLILTKDTSSPIPKLKISNYKGNVLFDTPKDIFLANQFYTAPELYLNKTFDNSDIWSVGMLIYVLFTSKFPFVPSKLYESLSKQVKIDLSSILDKSLVDLLSRMLIYDPIKRMSWDDFFIHPFIQRCRDHKIESICGNAEPYTPKRL
ncbi:putative serine/threonine kinase 3 [Entamoeba marina]